MKIRQATGLDQDSQTTIMGKSLLDVNSEGDIFVDLSASQIGQSPTAVIDYRGFGRTNN